MEFEAIVPGWLYNLIRTTTSCRTLQRLSLALCGVPLQYTDRVISDFRS